MDNDYQKDFVRRIRGSRSTQEISQALGFKSNMAYSWEKGLRRLSWEHFIQLCEFCDANFLRDFEKYYLINFDLSDQTKFIKHFTGHLSNKELAALLKASPSKITKLLQQSEKLLFQDAIKILPVVGKSLTNFLVSQDKFADLKDATDNRKLRKIFSADHNHMNICFFIDLEEYKNGEINHTEMARFLDIEPHALQSYFGVLEREGVIKKNGELWVRNPEVVYMNSFNQSSLNTINHYFNRITKRLLKTPDAPGVRWEVFTIDPIGFEALRKLHGEFTKKSEKIIADSLGRPHNQIIFQLRAVDTIVKTKAD